MNFLIHFLIILCGLALIPAEVNATDLALLILMQLLILIFNFRVFKQGMVVGKDIVWQKLSETLAEKNIESVTIKHKPDYDKQ